MKNDLITLHASIRTYDDQGFEQEAKTKNTDMMADLTTVTRSEFYMAHREGLNVQMMAKVNKIDYECACLIDEAGKKHRPTSATADGYDYKILKFYFNKLKNEVELTLQEVD